MCLGFRSEGFTTIVTVENSGRQGAKLALRISETSSALHRINLVPVCQPFSPQASSNMSTVEVERLVLAPRRKILTGLSMPKSKACRKLVFEPSSNQNDREEDAASEETSDNYLQEHRQRQMQRWGFDFGAGQPLPNGRLNWEAESEERVPAFYRESCLRSPPRRNHRVRRNIMSARTSESAEHHHPADNGTLAGQVHGSRVSASARSETETASVAVSTCTSSVHREELTSKDIINHGCNSVETSNNGISSRPSTSTGSKASKTQSTIHGMYNNYYVQLALYLLSPCYIPPSLSHTQSSTIFSSTLHLFHVLFSSMTALILHKAAIFFHTTHFVSDLLSFALGVAFADLLPKSAKMLSFRATPFISSPHRDACTRTHTYISAEG